jgi:hypothetical protein
MSHFVHTCLSCSVLLLQLKCIHVRVKGTNLYCTSSIVFQHVSIEFGRRAASGPLRHLMNLSIPFMWLLLRPSPAQVQLRNFNASLVLSVMAVGLGSQCKHCRMYSVSKPGSDARYVVIFVLIVSLDCVGLLSDMICVEFSSGVSAMKRSESFSPGLLEFVLSFPISVIGVVKLPSLK